MQAIKVGIIGMGRQGSLHLEYFLQSPYFELIGCYDNSPEKLQRIQEDYSVKIFDNYEVLMKLSDAIIIATPAKYHYFYAEKAIKNSKHIFVESPISEDLTEAENLMHLSIEAHVKVQVGHIDRFNPSVLNYKKIHFEPKIIVSERMMMFDIHKANKSIVYDLMIHDIDLILHLISANVKKVQAIGMNIMSEIPDIIIANLEFDNGSQAVLRAGRSILQKTKSMDFYGKGDSAKIDFLKRTLEYTTIKDDYVHGGVLTKMDGQNKYIFSELINSREYDSLKLQMDDFAASIIEDKAPDVSIEQAITTLNVAQKILDSVHSKSF